MLNYRNVQCLIIFVFLGYDCLDKLLAMLLVAFLLHAASWVGSISATENLALDVAPWKRNMEFDALFFMFRHINLLFMFFNFKVNWYLHYRFHLAKAIVLLH